MSRTLIIRHICAVTSTNPCGGCDLLHMTGYSSVGNICLTRYIVTLRLCLCHFRGDTHCLRDPWGKKMTTALALICSSWHLIVETLPVAVAVVLIKKSELTRFILQYVVSCSQHLFAVWARCYNFSPQSRASANPGVFLMFGCSWTIQNARVSICFIWAYTCTDRTELDTTRGKQAGTDGITLHSIPRACFFTHFFSSWLV